MFMVKRMAPRVFQAIFILINILKSVAGDSALEHVRLSPFVLQDLTDSKCFGGHSFVRCSRDTLWFVTGKPGEYQLHSYFDTDSPEECLCKANCLADVSPLKISSCVHCGSRFWNILGDSSSGFILTQDDNTHCVIRADDVPMMVECEKGYSLLSLQLMTKTEIASMEGASASLVAASEAGSLAEVISHLAEEGLDVNTRNWDGRTALIAAATAGHLRLVEVLISRGADAALRDKTNTTAVMAAAHKGFLPVVRLLMGAHPDMDVDSAGPDAATSLWLAAAAGHAETVSYLLEKGADPNAARKDGVTALMASSSAGYVEVVRALLTAGASVAEHDLDNGSTALVGAAENGGSEIVDMLLSHGASVNALSKTGLSPLIVACAQGHLGIARQLLDAGAELELPHPQGVTPLMYAATGGFTELVELLLQRRAPVNTRHAQGGSALMEAATTGHLGALNQLLAAGADPLVVDEDGITTLMAAASQGHLSVCRVLVARGVEVNAAAESGGTALMFAAGGGHDSTVQFLLEKGAAVDAIAVATSKYIAATAKAISEGQDVVDPHKEGVTALLLAAQGGHQSTVEALVVGGASVELRDDDGMSALCYAVKGSFAEVAGYLLRRGADPNGLFVDDRGVPQDLLMYAIGTKDEALAALLVERGANTWNRDRDGATAIVHAAHTGLADTVKVLLDAGADPLAANNAGVGAVMAAASEGHAEIVQLLLHRSGGRSLELANSKDDDDTSALMAAAVRGHPSVAAALLLGGADVNAQNVDGHTALMFAHNGKHQLELLLDQFIRGGSADADMTADAGSASSVSAALQIQDAIVGLLMAHGATSESKDAEGHAAADFLYRLFVRV